MARVYLAGPEVFLTNAREVGERKKAICAEHDLEGLFPLDQEIESTGLSPSALAVRIYDANCALMRSCNALIANMTPFRSPSMDVGTAFEVGFAEALGKPVFGYSNVAPLLVDRVLKDCGGHRRDGAKPLDPRGLEIEDFGLAENLMIAVPTERDGGEVFSGTVPEEELFLDLTSFERCVRRVAERLASRNMASS